MVCPGRLLLKLGLVLIALSLKWTFGADTDVVGLMLGQSGHHTAKAGNHQFCHFFVQLLWQHFNGNGLTLVLRLVGPCLLK